MNLAFSAGFLTATVLLYSWAYGAYRNTNAKLESDLLEELKSAGVSVTITGLFAMACAFAVAAAVQLDATIASIDVTTIAAIAVCAALCWFLPRRLMARADTARTGPSGSSPDGTVSTFPNKSRGTNSGATQPGKHRNAA